jgi:hypothetical protein
VREDELEAWKQRRPSVLLFPDDAHGHGGHGHGGHGREVDASQGPSRIFRDKEAVKVRPVAAPNIPEFGKQVAKGGQAKRPTVSKTRQGTVVHGSRTCGCTPPFACISCLVPFVLTRDHRRCHLMSVCVCITVLAVVCADRVCGVARAVPRAHRACERGAARGRATGNRLLCRWHPAAPLRDCACNTAQVTPSRCRR